MKLSSNFVSLHRCFKVHRRKLAAEVKRLHALLAHVNPTWFVSDKELTR